MNEESKDGLRNVYYLSIACLKDKFTKAIMALKILSFSSNLDLFLIRPEITMMPAPAQPTHGACDAEVTHDASRRQIKY